MRQVIAEAPAQEQGIIYTEADFVYLANEQMTVKIAALGAELKSIYLKAAAFEALHQPDELWGRQSPILFPFAGRLQNQTYTFQGQSYKMPMHGFLRDLNFTLLPESAEITSDSVKADFICRAAAQTLALYPFDFEVRVTYLLKGLSLTNAVTVKNLSQDTMYYALGFHPGFNLPSAAFCAQYLQACQQESAGERQLYIDDFYLHFGKSTKLNLMPIDQASGLCLNEVDAEVNLAEQNLYLSTQDFAIKPLFFKGSGESVCLVHKESKQPYLKLTYNLPVLGIWQENKPTKQADFICLEPWSSCVGHKDLIEDLASMHERLTLAAGASNTATYTVEFLPAAC